MLEGDCDTPENRGLVLKVIVAHYDENPESLWEEDTLAFLAHTRATDDRLWLAHVAPIIQYWAKEDRERLSRVLDGLCQAKEVNPNPPTFDTFSAEDLRLEDVPETKWIIKGLLPEGLASLAGRPKQGKSWLALNMGIAVADGGKALGDYEIPSPGSVLFLALEDNKSRIKKRMQQLMRQVMPWPGKLKFALISPRMGAGFVEAVREWLETNPNPTFVIVDMYTKVAERRKKKSNQSDYDDIYEELAPLQALAYEYHICVLLVMHLNKTVDVEDATARIMGSTAFAGATVTNLILRRLTAGDAADAVLTPNGKDIEDDEDIALVFDRGIWTSRGNADVYNQSQQRLEILQALYMASGKECTPKDIALALDKNAATTRKLLQKLREDGMVTRDLMGNTYHLTNAGAEVLSARSDDEDRGRNLDKFENDAEPPKKNDPPSWMDSIDTDF